MYVKSNNEIVKYGFDKDDNEFCILHLSDLHINGTVLGDRFKRLFKDIQSRTKGVKKIVVVVTGDIASEGGVKTSQGAIAEFFRRLKKCMDSQIVDVEIVPGNHDIDREKYFSEGRYEGALADYDHLLIEIGEALGVECHSDKRSGVNVVQYGDRSVCFVRMDTSWYLTEKKFEECIEKHCKGRTKKSLSRFRDCVVKNRDRYIRECYRKLQDELNNAREECEQSGRPVELTIALAHHPLSWLIGGSCERYADFLQAKGLRKIDMWLCGHAHDVQIHYDNDNNQSTVVLMTGMGTDDCLRSCHRYSIYKLNLIRNVCAITIRKAMSEGTFTDDDSLIPTEAFRCCGHFCYPLKAISPGAVISLNAQKHCEQKSMYVDQTAVVLMQEIVRRMTELRIKLMGDADLIAECVLNNMLEVYEGKKECEDLAFDVIYGRDDKARKTKCWRRMISNPKVNVCEEFRKLLGMICDDVVSVVVMRMNACGDVLRNTPTFNENEDFCRTQWRAHFRTIGAMGFNGRKDRRYICVARNGGCNGAHDVPWRSAIRAAFCHKRKTLVHSAADVENPIQTSWDDFLTSIPDFEGNIAKLKEGNRPYLTFGLSASGENYESRYIARRILYLFEFFDLNSLVTSAIREFVSRIGIKMAIGTLQAGGDNEK